MFELRHYTTADGVDAFAQWLDSLRDRQAQARCQAADIKRAIERWQDWQQRSKP
jgi:putative component of toxin-antitoxin plasmid stabilization module